MNHHLNPTKTGLALGKLFGGIHLGWAVLVAFGWAQGLVDFLMWAHMVDSSVVVQPFDLSAAITLVIVATIAGYILGHFFARIWNWLYRS